MQFDRAEIDALLPLPPATFHILLALVDQERHGYAIIQDVEARTDGELRLSAGTLYRSVARMVEQGLIAEMTEATRSPPRRRASSLLPHHAVRHRRRESGDGAALPARPSRPRARPHAGDDMTPALARFYRALLYLYPVELPDGIPARPHRGVRGPDAGARLVRSHRFAV